MGNNLGNWPAPKRSIRFTKIKKNSGLRADHGFDARFLFWFSRGGKAPPTYDRPDARNVFRGGFENLPRNRPGKKQRISGKPFLALVLRGPAVGVAFRKPETPPRLGDCPRRRGLCLTVIDLNFAAAHFLLFWRKKTNGFALASKICSWNVRAVLPEGAGGVL